MAYAPLNQYADDAEKQKQQQSDQNGAAAPQAPTTGGGGEAAESSGGGNAPKPAGAPTSSGRFTNLQTYLKANSGYNKEGGGLAGQVYNTLDTQGKGVAKDINDTTSSYNTAAQNAAIKDNPQWSQNVLNHPENASDEDVKKYQTYMQGQYKGPMSLSDISGYGDVAANTENFKQTADLAGSESGRRALLGKLYGTGGNYTSGQQSLDNLLLQGNQDQLSKLNQVGSIGNNLSKQLSDAQQASIDQGLNNKAEAATTGQHLTDLLKGSINTNQEALQSKLGVAQQKRDQELSDLKAHLSSGTISPEEAKTLGLLSGTSTYGVDLSKFLTPTGGPLTLGNIATSEDQARLAGLGKLAGNPALQDQTITKATSGPGYALNGWQQAVAAGKANYEDQLKKLKDAVNVDNLNIGLNQTDPVTAAANQALAGKGLGSIPNSGGAASQLVSAMDSLNPWADHSEENNQIKQNEVARIAEAQRQLSIHNAQIAALQKQYGGNIKFK